MTKEAALGYLMAAIQVFESDHGWSEKHTEELLADMTYVMDSFPVEEAEQLFFHNSREEK